VRVQESEGSGCLEMGIQTPMAQGRSTKIISIIKWIRTSRLSIKNSLSLRVQGRCLVKARCGDMPAVGSFGFRIEGLRLIDFVYHSTLGLRVIKRRKRRFRV